MEIGKEMETLQLENQPQLENNKQDLKREREDRKRAVEERLKMEKELNVYKGAMTHLNTQVEKLSLQLIEKDEVIQRFGVHRKEELKTTLEENERMKVENKALITRVEELEGQLNTCKQQLKFYYKRYTSVRRGFQSLENNASSTENVMQEAVKKLHVHLNTTVLELEAAKEEIAVKVAQVKQYQKQVEAYKQQLEQCRSSVDLVPGHPPQLPRPEDTSQSVCKAINSSSEPVHSEHTNISLRGHADCACDGDNMSSTASQTAVSNCVSDGEDDSDDDLPPPIFGNPFQPMYHPAVAHGMRKEDVPLSQLEVSKLAVGCSQMEHTVGNVSPSTPDLRQTVDNIAGEMHKNILPVAAIQRDSVYEEFEETCSIVPLDPNLKCPICRKAFKKGRIQKYKRHVQICGMQSYTGDKYM